MSTPDYTPENYPLDFANQQPQGTTPQEPTPPSPIPSSNSIENLYSQYLGRGSDEGGLNYWSNQLNNGTSLADIQNAFQNSAEGQAYASSIPPYRDHTTGYPPPITPEPVYGSGTGPYHDPNPQVSPLEFNPQPLYNQPEVDPVYFDQDGNPHRGYQPGYTTRAPVYPTGREGIDFDYGMGVNPQVSPLERDDPQVTRFTDWEPMGRDIYDDYGNVIGQRSEQERMTPPKWYTDQFINQPVKKVTEKGYDPMGEDDYWKAAEDQRKGIVQSGGGYSRTDIDPVTGKIIGVGDGFPVQRNGYGYGTAIDPVMDFVTNIDQQLPYLQRAFQEQLQRFGDPVQAARVVLGSLK